MAARLSALWQLVAAAPLRRTQGGAFFKRDLDRLRADPVLNGSPSDSLAELPDLALLAVALAEAEGIVRDNDGEVGAGSLPASWDDGPVASPGIALRRPVPAGIVGPAGRLPHDGGRYRQPVPVGLPARPGRAAPAAGRRLRLARRPWKRGCVEHHPYWAQEDARPSRFRSWVGTFLLGLLFPCGWCRRPRTRPAAWAVRLSPLGRWLLGQGEPARGSAAFPQTLLVQPNLEILAYRQGLTPALIAQPDPLRRLEGPRRGLHAAAASRTRSTAPWKPARPSRRSCRRWSSTAPGRRRRAVIDSLRTWANKRDRITVYPSAALLEFASAEELNEALARGVPAVRLTDRLAVVPTTTPSTSTTSG